MSEDYSWMARCGCLAFIIAVKLALVCTMIWAVVKTVQWLVPK